ncbi:hypothetical protein HYY27_01750, partial [bacterium]|nr:hypothetical protein [bacterium]
MSNVKWNLLFALLFPAVLWADSPGPRVPASACVDSSASIVGYVTLGERAFLAPQSSVRAGAGAPVVIGD